MKKNVCPYEENEILCEKTEPCLGCEYCPDTEIKWEDLEGTSGTFMSYEEIAALEYKAHQKGYAEGYEDGVTDYAEEEMEDFEDFEDLSAEEKASWRAGYRQGRLDFSLDSETDLLKIDPFFLDYIDKIRSSVMGLRDKKEEERFNFYLYDICGQLSDLVDWYLKDKVFRYWGFK